MQFWILHLKLLKEFKILPHYLMIKVMNIEKDNQEYFMNQHNFTKITQLMIQN